MLKLIKASVISQEELYKYIKDGYCESIDDLDYDLTQEFDYAQTALIDMDNNHIIYWSDNIHSDPDLFIKAFESGLKYSNVEYIIIDSVVLNKDLESMTGEKY